ncbi:MAG: PAS domain S-box protein [Ferruginibacter sp.]
MEHPLTNNFAAFLNEESYKDLFDNAHDLIHFISPEGIILYANQSWCKTLGYPLEKIVGTSVYDHIIQEQKENFILYRENILYTDKMPTEILVNFSTSSGAVVSLEGFVSLRKKNNTPQYTRGIFRDITTRQETEIQIKERERYMAQLLENAPDAVIVINEQGMVNFWNPKAEAIFGWSAEEVMGHSLSGIIIPDIYRAAHEEGMHRLKMTGEAHVLNKTIEITALKKSGEEFHISLTISPVDLKNEKAYIAFLRDRTKQKSNEAELEIRRKQLEASNQQLSQYAYVASHDLQEPLRKITIYSEMLTAYFPPGTQELTYAEKIILSAKRMRGLINSLLDYSNVSQGNLSFEKVDLNNILENVLGDFELLITQKNAAIRKEVLPTIMALPLQMNQLFYNLVGNALKFTHPDVKPVVSIETGSVSSQQIEDWELDPGQEYIKIILRDNGVGFEQIYAGKIFNIFQRLNNSSDFGGYGIGLALCKKVTDTHKGYLSAEGELNKGASFTLVLPVTQI